MTDDSIEPYPNPTSPVPPPSEPVSPVQEPEPDRLPDEAPDPNPDENDEPSKYSVRELRMVYGLSRQDATRKIYRFGSRKEELDMLLGARRRTQAHRIEDIDRSIGQVTFG